jgi:hypothetical protein
MKYEPLEQYLSASVQDVTVLEFVEIERILGACLPASARKYPAWWSNSGEGHVNAQAWLRAGFKAEQLDLDRARVAFRRVGDRSINDAGSAPQPGFLERVRAALGGTVTIMPGVDLTEPLWEWMDEDEQG